LTAACLEAAAAYLEAAHTAACLEDSNHFN
jgi:hypothetical protein